MSGRAAMMANTRDQIAVAGSDDPSCAALSDWFSGHGFLVLACKTWCELLVAARHPPLRLILLRDDLDEIPAVEAALRLRWHGVRTPLLLLGQSPTPEQILRAVQLGASALLSADDLSRVFMYAEAMIAREQAAGMSVIRRGPFLVDLVKRSLNVEGTRILLTHGEARIFAFLCRHANAVVRLDELVVEIGGLAPNESSRKAMAQQVFRLRAKLGPWRDSIQTLRGSGYRLDVPRTRSPKNVEKFPPHELRRRV
jgi:DNA-binding response OmpR family regulator